MRHSRRHESEPRSAKLQWHAEALALADSDIDSEVARCAEQAECDAFCGGGDSDTAGAMRNLCDGAERFDDSKCIGIASHGAEEPVVCDLFEGNRAGRAGRFVERDFDDFDSTECAKVGAN